MVVKEKKESSFIVTTKEMSEILGLSDRRIRQLENDGALVKITHGKFDLPASIRAYINHLNTDTVEELNKTEEEALWTRARRQKAELELQIMKGELHRSEDVKRVMNNMLGAFRARILAIPSKTAGPLQGKSDFNEIRGILKESVYEALTELSDYDPYVFYAESKDTLSIDEESESVADQIDKELHNNGSKKKK
ncbi:hypothetical protein [Bacillus solitudinis]|uniref:hypothetical protein n=1 Tax=Bacillus solitudinis TaxID=2014074 RepID=UPI0018E24B0F|nr:hypothetical protein [Bacillus solitudinis]